MRQGIRIMRHSLPRGGEWLVRAVFGVSLACVPVAAQPPMPALSTAASPAIESVESLRKPPPATNPWPEKARAAVRATYPELFTAPAGAGQTLVIIALNSDGTIYKSTKRAMGAETVATSQKTYDAVGVEMEDFQATGTSGGVSDGTLGIVLGAPDIEPSVGITGGASADAQDPVFISLRDPRPFALPT
jgi:hypothetical protein